MKKHILAGLLAALMLAVLSGCGSASYADGTYEGRSSVYEADEEGNGDGYGVVSITIQNNVITACAFHTYQTDGTLKDEDYGKANGVIANTDYYNKAQRAVLACQEYADQLAQSGNLDEVDAISGATISYHEFQDAVRDALSQAKT